MQIPFLSADILLPSCGDGRLWSCVACDQYTSQPDYWASADALVGDAPSTLRLILPEVYLAETDTRKPAILSAMDRYMASVLTEHRDTMILVERTLGSGETRLGLMGMVDLMEYDYRKGADSLIRATEATVAERIPARTAIRRDAPLELPHVMMLIDDRRKTVVEPLFEKREALSVAYDHDLMQGGGHVKGYFLSSADVAGVTEALGALITPEAMAERYGDGALAPLLFAVGDGNHSLAAAKTCFEEVRAAIGDEAAMSHPARYALCEVVNLYDDSLQFEPIYRTVFGVQPDALSMAKALANGVPMGAMICQRKLQDVLTPGTHASTFGGTPFASAVAATVIDTILKDNLLENCRVQGDFLREGLQKLAEKHPMVKGVRGKGLMVGAILDEPAGPVLAILRSKGVIALSAGETVLRLVPALTISREDCEKALALIDEALTVREAERA
jgi:hypothetical protein